MIGWFERNRGFSIIFVILIAVEIFFFSSISGDALAPAPSISSIPIIYHFSVFFLLNFFILTSLNGNKKIKIRYLITALIFSIIYSILDEMHQLFVPFRNADLGDVLIDNIGILSSNLVYLYSKR